MIRSFTILVVLIFSLACSSNSQQSKTASSSADKTSTYLALGDSYTIGESVVDTMRWPVQLAQRFEKDGIAVAAPRIIATTGWTTDELKKAVIDANIVETYDIVSLLIGVNNQYRGYPFDNYEKEFRELLEMAIGYADNKRNRVFVVSIPDYGVTPFGLKKDHVRIGDEIDRYNSTAKAICADFNVTYINITDISRKAEDDISLVAKDGLHPSGKMYSDWVERIYPQVKPITEQ